MEYSLNTSKYHQFATDYGFYDPLRSGNIDGISDTNPHDHGIIRALNSTHYKPNLSVKSNPYRTLFIGRINYETDEIDLKKIFERFGTLVSFRLVRDIVTGFSKGYAFAEYKHRRDAKYAHEKCFKLSVDDRVLLVEFEHERDLKGWVPRRLGGGLGGYKISGQLRFGGRYKPFKKPVKSSNN